MPRPFLVPLLLAALSFQTHAQGQTPVGQPEAVPATGITAQAEPALESFVASYLVYKGDKQLGAATMQLVPQQASRWRVDLVMRGTRGLIGLAGINAEQSTVFDLVGETYRPLSQATVNKTVFTRKQTVGIYDWRAGSAQWQGDVKESRRRPIDLQPGDMTGLLINLAVIRDAEPGKHLQYRFVDDGRTRDHRYIVADELESITIGDLPYKAMKVSRVEEGNDETIIWVVKNVPTPIRILQREDGEDTYDLRLVEYKGVD